MNCHVSKGDQPVKITWTFNGHELTSRLEIVTQKIGTRTSLLTISNVKEQHAGNYTCTATNAAGSINHTAIVYVKGTNPNFLFLFIYFFFLPALS